ncbi:MAG: hypothetical protein J6Y20_08945 [Lachnospiraceae bacterium]|nr:hypothetical protein [Lachnospiraceae bacterium]
MVSFTVYKPNTGGAYIEGVCLATDEKPIAGITNGSILFSVDTTDGSMTRYMFDQSAGEWIETECPCSGGGSGGGGGGGGESSNVLVVPLTIDGATWTATKTAGEMAAAGVIVYTYPLSAGVEARVVEYSRVVGDGYYVFDFLDNYILGDYVSIGAVSADDYPTNEEPPEPGPM